LTWLRRKTFIKSLLIKFWHWRLFVARSICWVRFLIIHSDSDNSDLLIGCLSGISLFSESESFLEFDASDASGSSCISDLILYLPGSFCTSNFCLILSISSFLDCGFYFASFSVENLDLLFSLLNLILSQNLLQSKLS
jgi:hypothetical protein